MSKFNVDALAEKAAFKTSQGSYWTNVKGTGSNLEQFAELIVQECIDAINEINVIDTVVDQDGPVLMQAASAVKMRDRIIAVLREQVENVEG